MRTSWPLRKRNKTWALRTRCLEQATMTSAMSLKFMACDSSSVQAPSGFRNLPVSAWTMSLLGLSGTGMGTLTLPLKSDSREIPYRAREPRLQIITAHVDARGCLGFSGRGKRSDGLIGKAFCTCTKAHCEEASTSAGQSSSFCPCAKRTMNRVAAETRIP
jgi:hypothetical protein